MISLSRFIALFCVILAGAYEENSFAGGRSAAQFLNLATGGRAAGLARAFTAVTDDVSSIFHNPAGLGEAKGLQGILLYQRWIGETNLATLGFSKDMNSLGTLGVGMLYLGLPPTEGYDDSNNAIGTFVMNDLALSLSWGKKLTNNLSGGISARFVQEKIDTETATAVSTDLGLIYETNSGVRFGFVAANLGTGLKHIRESSPQASTVRLGAAVRFIENRLLTSMDITKQFDDELEVRVGTEFELAPVAHLRVGYAYELGGRGLDGFTGLSAGVGLAVGPMILDYALAPQGDFGLTHLVSLRFGDSITSRQGPDSLEKEKKPEAPKAKKKQVETVSKLAPKALLGSIVTTLKEKKPDEALKRLDKLGQKHPRDGRIFFYKGIAYRLKGNTRGARANFKAAMKLASPESNVYETSQKQLEQLEKK